MSEHVSEAEVQAAGEKLKAFVDFTQMMRDLN